MSETDSTPQNSPEQGGALDRALAAGPALEWDDDYADPGDGRPESVQHPGQIFRLFVEPDDR